MWEWVEDQFNGLPGFKSSYLYDDFSSPCFDGLHTMMLVLNLYCYNFETVFFCSGRIVDFYRGRGVTIFSVFISSAFFPTSWFSSGSRQQAHSCETVQRRCIHTGGWNNGSVCTKITASETESQLETLSLFLAITFCFTHLVLFSIFLRQSCHSTESTIQLFVSVN